MSDQNRQILSLIKNYTIRINLTTKYWLNVNRIATLPYHSSHLRTSLDQKYELNLLALFNFHNEYPYAYYHTKKYNTYHNQTQILSSRPSYLPDKNPSRKLSPHQSENAIYAIRGQYRNKFLLRRARTSSNSIIFNILGPFVTRVHAAIY